MENIKEIISQLFQSPEMTALISAAVAYLTANLGTIIVFACKMIKAKNAEIKQRAQSDAVIEALTAEYNAKVELLASKIDEKITKLDNHVTAKMEYIEDERKEEIKKQSVQLQEALTETKKALKIDDILSQ